jgi:hypothetical protein
MERAIRQSLMLHRKVMLKAPSHRAYSVPSLSLMR